MEKDLLIRVALAGIGATTSMACGFASGTTKVTNPGSSNPLEQRGALSAGTSPLYSIFGSMSLRKSKRASKIRWLSRPAWRLAFRAAQPGRRRAFCPRDFRFGRSPFHGSQCGASQRCRARPHLGPNLAPVTTADIEETNANYQAAKTSAKQHPIAVPLPPRLGNMYAAARSVRRRAGDGGGGVDPFGVDPSAAAVGPA